MLGIRHYGGVAIDLWQGDATAFVSDVNGRLSAGDFDLLDDSILTYLRACVQAQSRHIAFEAGAQNGEKPISEANAGLAMSAVKAWIDSGKWQFPKRITFILPTGADYLLYQAALFSTFPEL